MEKIENIIDASQHFKGKIQKFSKGPKTRIAKFIDTFQTGGFSAINSVTINGYIVRNKPSDDVPTDDPDWLLKVRYVQEHKLWHFHIGFYDVDCDFEGYKIAPSGDLTSQWVIHYQKFSDNHINIADITPHPPFDLPAKSHLIFPSSNSED